MPTETLTRAIPTMLFKSVLKDQHPGTPGTPGSPPPIGAASAKTTVGNITANPVKKVNSFLFIVSSFLMDQGI
jgi:hypothetical protein